jgi:hypothetical protein
VGVKTDDEEFIGLTTHEVIANGAAVAVPDTNNFPSISMNGFRTLQFAIKTTRAGTYNVKAIFGPDTKRFANLSPIAAGQNVRIIDDSSISDEALVDDNMNVDAANAWTVFTILRDRAVGQENLQLQITNSSGGNATIEFAFRRLV